MTAKESMGISSYPETLIMKYNKPAESWIEGLPIGNGHIAALICGLEPEKERLALNQEWLYKGIYKDREPDEIPRESLEKVRKLLFEHKYEEATNHVTELADFRNPTITEKNTLLIDPYQPAGDLTITELDSLGNILKDNKEYTRQLDLSKAIASVSRISEGINIKREFFASQGSLGNICIRLSAGKPICWKLQLSRIQDKDCNISAFSDSTERRIVLHGEFVGDSHFTVAVHIASTDGNPEFSEDSAEVLIKNAKTVTAFLAIGATDKSNNPDSEAYNYETCDFETVFKEHAKLYGESFNNCHVDIRCENSSAEKHEKIFTDELLREYKKGKCEDIIPILYFNYGRYLLISSSGELPANLQGKWNTQLLPPWNCDFHFDINLQMNYWMADKVGLSKYTDSLFNLCEGLIEEGKKAAYRHFGCRGVLFPLVADCHNRAVVSPCGCEIFVGIAAWLATHYWMHWEFSMDRDFLINRAYPFFKLIAEFYEDFLCEDPKGKLQIVPSQSPENSFEESGNAPSVSACVSSAIDIQLCRAVFNWVIYISDTFGVDRKECEKWIKIRKRLPRLRIGKDGELLEWSDELTERDPGHRHFSHLIGVYPIDIITEENMPEIFNACKVSLEHRLSHGGGHTGWSRAWTAGLYARFGDAESANEHIRALICDFATVSLLDMHDPSIFQIDGNFGGTAAIAEMLMQTYNGVIKPLAACPKSWKDGHVEGFHCRGGFIIDFDWSDGKLTRAFVTSNCGGICSIALKEMQECKISSGSFKIDYTIDENNMLRFETFAGQKYLIEFL